MKAGLITASISRRGGGLFWAVRSMSTSLMDAGFEIHVFGGSDEYSASDRLTWGKVPVSVQPSLGPRAFGYQSGLGRALNKYEPDVAHVHGLWMYPSVAAMRWAQGRKPYLVSPHGMLDPWAIRNSAWKKKLAGLLYEKAHLHRAACIHALCESEFLAIRAFGLRGPVAVVPNGVSLPCITASLAAPDWSFKLPVGAKVLLFLGRLHPKKGLSILLEAWALARRSAIGEAEGWHLVIAGWDQGGHQAELEDLARNLGIERSTHFVGPQFDNAKAASLLRADAFVLPSFSEGLPMAVMEAWAHARPVIMTPQCNLSEGFAAGAAIRVDPEAKSVEAGLGVLFGMTDHERRAMGQRGLALVKQQFTWSLIAAEMANVYRWVLGGGAQPDCVRTDRF